MVTCLVTLVNHWLIVIEQNEETMPLKYLYLKEIMMISLNFLKFFVGLLKLFWNTFI